MQTRRRIMRVLSTIQNMFIPPRCFSDAHLEEVFLQDHGKKFLNHRRATLIIALFTWTSYTGWDLFHAYMNLEFLKVSSQVYVLRAMGVVALEGVNNFV